MADNRCNCPCCQQGIEAPHEYHLERRPMALAKFAHGVKACRSPGRECEWPSLCEGRQCQYVPPAHGVPVRQELPDPECLKREPVCQGCGYEPPDCTCGVLVGGEALPQRPARCPQCKREGFLHTTWCAAGMDQPQQEKQ